MLVPISTETNAHDARARRAAKRVGLLAKTRRGSAGTLDNYGGFMVLNPATNTVVAGERFELCAEDVIDLCADRGRHS